ncbi:hypothetical protein IMSAGC019_00873 [Lachnospiraceae bacterium]|nr:hypothetical protein IMSAGC019_00873 [Lachnospiraceae bacterium]
MSIWKTGENKQTGEEKLSGVFFPGIGSQQRLAFICTVISMLLTHLYMFTNEIVNHDDVNRLLVGDTDEVKIQHGRWAGVIFDRVSGSMAGIPFVMGSISTLATAAACVVLVSILKTHRNLNTILVCLLISVFPVSANIFLYVYIADVYFISMFLAMWGVWLILERGKLQNWLGIVLLTLACGCYQAFWCFGISVLFLYFLLELYEGKKDEKELLKKIVACLIMAAISLVIYLLINKIVQNVTGYGATPYQGLDSMGEFQGLFHVLKILAVAYYEFIYFFYYNGFFVKSPVIAILNLMLTGVILWILVRRGLEKKDSLWYWIGTIGFICCIPLAANLISVASQNRTHILMQYGYAMPYFMCITLMEKGMVHKGGEKRRYYTTIAAIVYLMVCMVIYKSYLTVNEIYFRQQLNYEATYSYTLRLLYRMEEFEGYDPHMKVALINETPQRSDHITIMMENYPAEMAYFDYLNNMGGTDPRTFVKRANDIADFCRYFHGYDLRLAEIEDFAGLANTEEFSEMALYPDKGSMRVIDGVLVIKLPDEK